MRHKGKNIRITWNHIGVNPPNMDIEFIDDVKDYRFTDTIFEVTHEDDVIECYPMMNVRSITFPKDDKK